MAETMEETIVHVLKEKLAPFVIYLFGSTVNGTVRPNSDVDIAFLSDEKQLDPYELFMIAQELANLLKREVDLIDLQQASTVFQAQVVHTGKTIYCSDEKKRMEFELKAFKMYAKLNEERSVILKKISESGSVYGK
ncbi:putative nucleotidyltransferase [Anoxybacillus tepidamans]|uniref:Putative nucleotidyltransferase n=1 Tax=Anoxybacteroides tepidamans TaxID=265948 RepID=A0A7W8ISZ8_9BACL|nr:nucleotidyltransferase domain-containing protein [Anoxybacillus tepidamans]MBB5326106.1 putative nucleotidyltransferase [Anoxybacillus tepidamans]